MSSINDLIYGREENKSEESKQAVTNNSNKKFESKYK